MPCLDNRSIQCTERRGERKKIRASGLRALFARLLMVCPVHYRLTDGGANENSHANSRSKVCLTHYFLSFQRRDKPFGYLNYILYYAFR